jgi:D-lyxose ketol-isomerase
VSIFSIFLTNLYERDRERRGRSQIGRERKGKHLDKNTLHLQPGGERNLLPELVHMFLNGSGDRRVL